MQNETPKTKTVEVNPLMVQHNGLTAGEAERLDFLAEQCADVIKQISKIKRHGWKATDYATAEAHAKKTGMWTKAPITYNNRGILEEKVRDLNGAMLMMVSSGDLGGGIFGIAKPDMSYFHHQGPEWNPQLPTARTVTRDTP